LLPSQPSPAMIASSKVTRIALRADKRIIGAHLTIRK
jgi:hypothetical protein